MISIVMPLWNRTALLRNTLRSIVEQINVPDSLEIVVVEDRPQDQSGRLLCADYDVKYFSRQGGPGYQNVGPIYNCGIKQATGEIVIMQSAECMYESRTAISDLVAAVSQDELISAVPLVQSLAPNGQFIEWFCHPREGGRPGWTGMFCHAIHRSQLLKIGGYDEIFRGYGFDDDLLLYRLKRNGVKPQHIESALVSHQWHPRHHTIGQETQVNKKIFDAKIAAIEAGEPNVANVGREWGALC